MEVRDMRGNPGIWEQLAWEDMSSLEQQLWSQLGWQQSMWNSNSPPPSSSKAWGELNGMEQQAASQLGFTEGLWDGFEDQ
jgi:hypothetical protein